MALSNIFREPRREITETVAGLLWIGGAIAIGFHVPIWLGITDHTDKIALSILASVVLAIFPFVVFLVAVIVHGLGEIACETLANMRLDPRPRRRY